mmetsp:Transcript_28452/g.75214  ORF Transcript_28452/g.75214 Transcript_28452/m.75214 type:complete len:98 (+) Transcript_28452:272-565(+)
MGYRGPGRPGGGKHMVWAPAHTTGPVGTDVVGVPCFAQMVKAVLDCSGGKCLQRPNVGSIAGIQHIGALHRNKHQLEREMDTHIDLRPESLNAHVAC